MNRSEGFFASDLEAREQLSDCEVIIKNAPERIDPRNFAGLHTYPSSEVEADLSYVENIKNRISSDTYEDLDPLSGHRTQADNLRSEALEVIFGNGIEDNMWFGDSFYFARTSEFDDLRNGVDGVLEFYDEDSFREHLALAIDATRAIDTGVLEKKIGRNSDKLLARNGQRRSVVKYFESPKNGDKGGLRDVIPVVVGIDGKHADELIALFSTVQRLRKARAANPQDGKIQERLQAKQKELTEHPAALAFMIEILDQLGLYEKLLSREPRSAEHDGLLMKITVLRRLFEEAKTKKNQALGNLSDDRTLGGIRSIVSQRMSRRGAA